MNAKSVLGMLAIFVAGIIVGVLLSSVLLNGTTSGQARLGSQRILAECNSNTDCTEGTQCNSGFCR